VRDHGAGACHHEWAVKRVKLVAGVAGTVAAVAAVGAVAVELARRSRQAPLVEDIGGRSFPVTTTDGAVLAATDAGRGPLIVLSHCYTGSRLVWMPVAARLVATGHRVVLYDQRGHGDSTVGSEGLTIDRLGEDLREVIEAVDAKGAVLAGHSMGGMAVLALAAHHPDVVAARARALVLVSTAASGLGTALVPAGTVAALLASPVATAVTGGPLGPFVGRVVHGRGMTWAQLVAGSKLYSKTAPATRAGFMRSMTKMDLRAGLEGCRVPAVVVVGEHDRLTPARFASDIVAHMPDADLIVVPRAGHMLPWEAPDRLAEVLSAMAVVAPTSLTAP
jgi:pimeloyl-ACP methyl ester carboxylesterase